MRARLRHRQGCYRWIGDGRCVDCGRYTGIASAAVEVLADGEIHYYDPRAAKRYGIKPSALPYPNHPAAPAVGAPDWAPPPPIPTALEAAPPGVLPVSERDLVRRDDPVPVTYPPPNDADPLADPIVYPPPEPPAARAKKKKKPHEVVSEQRVQPEAMLPQPDADVGLDDAVAVFRAKVRRAREQLAEADQRPRRK